jgi:hypothetical protein
MEQPTIATARPLTPKGAAYHRAVAREQPIPRVQLVDLRTVRYTHDEQPEPGEGREYTRRWLVRGHWRQQACGPQRSQRRPTWIAPYIKGPGEAPLIVTDHVNVWRR